MSTFSRSTRLAVWQLVNTFSICVGKACGEVRRGFAAIRFECDTLRRPNPTGAFGFTTNGVRTSRGVANTGNAIASFLLGQVDNFQIDLQTSKIRPRDHIEEYFVQDDWKVSPRLTLNLGARYTLHHPSTEVNNQGAVFQPEYTTAAVHGAEWVSAIGAGAAL